VLHDRSEPRLVAALMHAVLVNHARQEDILRGQDAALGRLLARDFAGTLLRFVDEVLAAPRLPPPAVAPDFWTQFRLAEELEQIRQSRPAAFRALPLAPDDRGPVADLGHRR
jgi:hypothetical protein